MAVASSGVAFIEAILASELLESQAGESPLTGAQSSSAPAAVSAVQSGSLGPMDHGDNDVMSPTETYQETEGSFERPSPTEPAIPKAVSETLVHGPATSPQVLELLNELAKKDKVIAHLSDVNVHMADEVAHLEKIVEAHDEPNDLMEDLPAPPVHLV